jgi:uncharacterized protein (DUF4213/DUF364 family)
MIVEENVEYLRKFYPAMLNLTIADLRVGAYMMAVKLSDGSLGLASSEMDDHIHCSKENRDFGEFTPLKITGRTLAQLFDTSITSSLICALKVAVLNAVSNRINQMKGAGIIRNVELTDLLRQGKEHKVVMVGAFHSYISRIAASGRQLAVLELNRDAMLPEHVQYFRPAEQFPEVLSDAGIVIITGLTVVNNTFDDLLQACPHNAQIAVIGPSSNLIADVLFSKNIEIIGSTLITKPDLLFDLISQGAAGYHLFEYCAEKVFLINHRKN